MRDVSRYAVCLAAAGVMEIGLLGPASTPTSASQNLPKDQLDFFENRIRPILAERCVRCHGSSSAPKSGLELDWKGGWQKGGLRGPAIVAGDPEKSVLIGA